MSADCFFFAPAAIHFSGLYINVVTHVSLVLSIGLLVDYFIHILLRYYESHEATREEKVKDTLRSIGAAVFSGGMSTFLGVVPLAFSTSAVLRTVFFCFLSMVSLGLANGLILLPVILSIIGPTSGPHSAAPSKKSKNDDNTQNTNIHSGSSTDSSSDSQTTSGSSPSNGPTSRTTSDPISGPSSRPTSGPTTSQEQKEVTTLATLQYCEEFSTECVYWGKPLPEDAMEQPSQV